MLTSQYDPRTKLVRYIEEELAKPGRNGVFLSHGFRDVARDYYEIILHSYPTERKCIDTLSTMPPAGIVMHIRYNSSIRMARIVENGRSISVKPEDFGRIFGDIRHALENRAPSAA